MLPNNFPFAEIFKLFLNDYTTTATYWYVPKARSLSEDNVGHMRSMIKTIFDKYLDSAWNRDTQETLLEELIREGVFEPTRPEGSKGDRTALVRINEVLLETLGLMWIEDEEIIITDAGLDLIASEEKDWNKVINRQIVKYQYPNPLLSDRYRAQFSGILPHLFLLQVLMEMDNYLTYDEFELFLNLAHSQEELAKICNYIKSWRDLTDAEQNVIFEIVRSIPVYERQEQMRLVDLEDVQEEAQPTRYTRIAQSAPYQRSFFCFPEYLILGEDTITCEARDEVNQLIHGYIENLKFSNFEETADWISYYGDPTRQPSWFTYLIDEIDKSQEVEQTMELVAENIEKLSDEEKEILKIHQLEKDIESFYVGQLDLLEKGLKLATVNDQLGRQFSTPIGRIDLLCTDAEENYVVVEVKAYEARDSSFGQVLRYMGWVFRNLEDSEGKVRGIILANRFPETARYSRIGLQREDYKEFIQFKEHGLGLSDSEQANWPKSYVNRIIHGDALRTMKQLPDSCISLVVTSPPYWNMADYHVEGQIGQTDYEDYLQEMVPVWKETLRVLIPNGKMAIITPIMPISKEIIGDQHTRHLKNINNDIEYSILNGITGFERYSLFIWQKQTSKKMFGSYPYPPNIYEDNTIEFINVFVKEGQPPPVELKAKENSKLTQNEWRNLTMQVWPIYPQDVTRSNGHPAPFPVVLPMRLIYMYTFAKAEEFKFGGDIVLDMFNGSGSTCVAAKATGRNWIGIDLNPDYCQTAVNRLAHEGVDEKAILLESPKVKSGKKQ